MELRNFIVLDCLVLQYGAVFGMAEIHLVIRLLSKTCSHSIDIGGRPEKIRSMLNFDLPLSSPVLLCLSELNPQSSTKCQRDLVPCNNYNRDAMDHTLATRQ